MKKLFLGCILLILLAPRTGQAAPADTSEICVEYAVQVARTPVFGHFLAGAIGWLAQRFGIIPSGLSYTKTVIDSAGAEKGFVLDFRDQSGRRWIHIASDTAQPSFVDPPQFKQGMSNSGKIGADGVRFTAAIQDFFHRPDSTEWSGTFILRKESGKDTLNFYVFRSLLDAADTTYRRFSPVMYWLMSFNGRGQPYLSCKVRVGVWKGQTVYLWTDVHLDQQGVGIILKMRRLSIHFSIH